jgi:hypothetical protein
MADGWRTLRELDAALQRPKGTAFRAFKRLVETLQEGRDFRVLRRDRDGEEIQHLRTAARIYASSINVVLLSPAAAAAVGAAVIAPAGERPRDG